LLYSTPSSGAMLGQLNRGDAAAWCCCPDATAKHTCCNAQVQPAYVAPFVPCLCFSLAEMLSASKQRRLHLS
jgi:hypothetical protein